MKPSRAYVAFVTGPPLVVLLPVALGYLNSVASLTRGELWIVSWSAVALYLIGVAGCAAMLLPSASAVEEAAASGASLSEPISECLVRTEVAAGLLWIGWGGLVALAGMLAVRRTLFGAQVFTEAALLIAAPAMAWAYWGGKGFLLRLAADEKDLRYTGTPATVGMKIAIVFIGFFIVSVGALVQLIGSHVSVRLHAGVVSIQALINEITLFGIMVGLFTTVLFAIATYLLARDISAPVDELARFASVLAEGNLDVAPRIFSDDEIGRVADDFGATRRNLRSLVGQVGSSGSAIADRVRSMTGGTSTLLKGAHEQTELAESTTKALAQVRTEAQSVLDAVESVTHRTLDSASRATELSASSVEVARRMEELFQSVEKTSSSTLEIDASARETSHRTTDVSGVAGEVLSFVMQMDASIENIHRSSEATAAFSEEVRENAMHGRQAVTETVAGIRSAQESTRRTAGAFDSLQRSIGQIDQILLLIEELTNRTNLLSFNAAIIAAQAGDQDYGFSVIADEVRQLAERTRAATKDISVIVRGVGPIAQEALRAIDEGVTRVDSTVELAHRAESALATILASADRSRDMARTISTSLQDQSKASRHLHEVMSRLSDTVTEIHRAAAGQAEATQMLAAEADRVRDIALQVKRAADEQTSASSGIARSMEEIVAGVKLVRERVQHQLVRAEDIAGASRVTLSIAKSSNDIAVGFSDALTALLQNGQDFEDVVQRFRV